MPSGQDRFQAELLSRSQRDRILAAMTELVAKRGYQDTTVELIVKRAGVARATFYQYFANREACMLACFDAAVAEITSLIVTAAETAQSWPDQVRAGLAALLDYLVANPAVARTVVVESMTAGPAAMERYEGALQSFTPALIPGRALRTGAEELPSTLEDSIVGGVVWMLHQRLTRGELDTVPELLPTMLEFALSPYLGEQRAAEAAASA
jgi:AcrR family transcriptional regulator